MMSTFKLATGGTDIKIWELPDYTLGHQFSPHSGGISNLSWSVDGLFLASASITGDKIVKTLVKPPSYEATALTSMRQQICLEYNCTNSRYIASSGKGGQVNLWDVKTLKVKRNFNFNIGTVNTLHWNGNDTHIIIGSSKGDVLQFNVTTGLHMAFERPPKIQGIRSVKFSHVKRTLAGSVSDDGSLNVWDVNTRHLVQNFPEVHVAPATSLVFSAIDPSLVASVGFDKKLSIYNIGTKEIVQHKKVDQPLTSVDILQDGVTIACGGMRGEVQIFDLRKLDYPVRTLTAHTTSVQSLRFQRAKQLPATNLKRQTKIMPPAATASIPKLVPMMHKLSSMPCFPEQSRFITDCHIVSSMDQIIGGAGDTASSADRIEIDSVDGSLANSSSNVNAGNAPLYSGCMLLSSSGSRRRSLSTSSIGNASGVCAHWNSQQSNTSNVDEVLTPTTNVNRRTSTSFSSLFSDLHTPPIRSSLVPTYEPPHIVIGPKTPSSLPVKCHTPSSAVGAAAVQNELAEAAIVNYSPSFRKRHSMCLLEEPQGEVEENSSESGPVLGGPLADGSRGGPSPQLLNGNISGSHHLIGDHQSLPQVPFDVSFLRNMMSDVMEEYLDPIVERLKQMDVNVLRYTLIIENQIIALDRRITANEDLAAENRWLQEENRRLNARLRY